MAKTAAGIGAETTVRDAVLSYPGIEAVFDKYGLGGCGGAGGPLEPIGFFARMHGVEPQTLLRELNEFAAGAAPVHRTAAPAPAGESSSYALFLSTSVALAVVVGFPVGILTAFAMSRDSSLHGLWMPLVQAHGQVQIMGWVGLFIMGMAYHIVPRFKSTPLRYPALVLPSYVLVTTSLLLRMATQPAADHTWAVSLLILSGALGAAGVLAFAASITATIAAGRRERYDAFLLGGVAYLVAGTLANLTVLSELPSLGINVVPLPKQEPLLLLQLYGFITLFILGVSMRVLPAFLGLRKARRELFPAAFVLVNAGVIGQAVAGWGAAYGGWDLGRLDSWGSLSMAVGLAAFIVGLNILLPSAESTPGSRGYRLLARGAYVWLLATAGLEAYYAFRATSGDGIGADWLESGGIRHTLAVGFVTQIIFAVGTRALPVFTGRRLYSNALTNAVFVLVNLAVLLRVYPAFHEMGSESWRWGAMGVGGLAGVLAVALFGYNILRTVRASDALELRETAAPAAAGGKPPVRQELPIGPDTVVAEALKAPGALEVFLRYGFAPLADPAHRAVVADKVTVGGAALVHGVDLEAFLSDLNRLRAR